MAHIVCVGDLMVDVLARLPGPLAIGSDTPAVITTTGGGAAANVASWLVADGCAATLVGRVGDDAAGRQVVDDVRAAGVDTRVTTDGDGRATGTCLVLVDPSAERTMIPDAGANAAPSDAALALDGLDADLLYVSGYTLLNPASRQVRRWGGTRRA